MEFKTRIGKIKNNSLQNLYYDITTFSSVNNDNYKVNNKKHRNIAIILVKNADGIITFNNSKINIGPKQLIYIPANIEHNIKVTSRVNSYTELLLSNNFSMPLPNRPVGITSSAKDYNFIYHLLSNLKDRTTSEYYRFNITRLLLSWIIEHSPTNSNNGLLSPKLENIIKYLRDNKFVYATLDEAAEISNMSKTNL